MPKDKEIDEETWRQQQAREAPVFAEHLTDPLRKAITSVIGTTRDTITSLIKPKYESSNNSSNFQIYEIQNKKDCKKNYTKSTKKASAKKGSSNNPKGNSSNKNGVKKCKIKKDSLTVNSITSSEDALNKFKGKTDWNPCDGKPQPCDPTESYCTEPILCLGKLKNPAFPGEITKCLDGAFVSVGPCGGSANSDDEEKKQYEEQSEKEKKFNQQSRLLYPCKEGETEACAANRGACSPPHILIDKIKNPEPDGVVKIQPECN